MDKKDQKKTEILRVLKEEGKVLTSAQIVEILDAAGVHYSERAVRMYLQTLDQQGFTASQGRKGRMITPLGIRELQGSDSVTRLGYLSAKIDLMTYRMTFDLPTCSGEVIANMSLLPISDFFACLDDIYQVFEQGYAMGELVSILKPGEKWYETVIPPGHVGFCTVCSVTFNGVLLKHGIPMASRFSGLLELRNGKPTRFTEIINYNATTVDPLAIFIRAGLTNYHGAIRTGNGLIGAAFRELPDESRQRVEGIIERMEKIGLGGFLKFGLPNQPILGIPVSDGYIGAIVVGGLNPIAILVESGKKVFKSWAISGLIDYHRLFHYTELRARLKEFM
ncbi:MAG: NrpR regulatory domain-containing protein [Planctomycetia bacterium]|nr:NrpR regulatory domain-containing protein [Planctomycetia bacterium]